MNSRELADKLKNNPKEKAQNIEEILKWCKKNAEHINVLDNDECFLAEESIKHLMQNKAKNPWDKEDAKFVVYFLAKKAINKFGLDKSVRSIGIVEESEQDAEAQSTIRGSCSYTMDNKFFDITYTQRVLDDLTSNNTEKFLEGLKTIYHEVQHARQLNSIVNEQREDGTTIPKSTTRYLSALEDIVSKTSKKFYNENYEKLLNENDANKTGLIEAYNTLQNYAPNLFKQIDWNKVLIRIKNYDKNFHDAIITLSTGKNYDFKKELDTRASEYITAHPELVEKYPILQMGFHKDGSKKDIIQLLEDRINMIEDGEDLERVNSLYEIIANHRNVTNGGLKGSKNEVLAISDYIERTGTEDEFVFNLLRYRLENRMKMTPEQIAEYMKNEYKIAAKVRQQKGEKELEPEQEESIRDEVGEELKTKTQNQQQDEEHAETIWMNRLQVKNDNVAKMQDGAKRQQDVVKLIQDLDREHRQERNQQIQEENQNNGQGR